MSKTNERKLENAKAIIIALRSKRFVIVRQNERKRLFPTNPICKRIRDLEPGDEVIYEGQSDSVMSLCEY